jgi:GTPase involved in cell partitioning and DNA repair
VKAGTGGFGFPKYGGEGGKGGDVSFVATDGMFTIIYHIHAV